ncbi:transglycosylase SLT domain-containing protein [Rahnella ecdela]|uniref:Transglycosylase SLT domain-containing protein n=1 Tax=Rahnella ecdela TaxID=2816250 RepID=A0ABS6LDX1_9GAMM|nr:transglycosylase SLT domain-containing protein [Rahnella ecdela]MBU9844821.1 transglycosylase SLT domain-containing protein [Rahnella ecdela]
MRCVLLCFTFLTSMNVHATDCFDRAGRDYHIDPDLLRAIALRESSMKPHAINFVGPDNYAIGEMQIHSHNFLSLSRLGITPYDLYNNQCLNIYTGAYYLAIAFNRWGVNWNSVGAYNAGFKKNRAQAKIRFNYAAKVYATYTVIKHEKSIISPPVNLGPH